MLDHNPQDVSELSGVPWNIEETEVETLQKRHVHLPKLEDYGYIEWRPDEEVAVKGPRFDEIRLVLELLDDHRDELPDGWL
ncbi:transcriptional regulator [Halosolutus amylolyticus]|uniref:Transcriptional regulator n=1 Tax=Halosolutus amylolyticus TaxID=2932267 RepID=A0ABD5PSS6_9EURY|nr:transcriptional regulator [Halosolutus amylolyticus]